MAHQKIQSKAHRCHRRLWLWLARTGSGSKADAADALHLSDKDLGGNLCSACNTVPLHPHVGIMTSCGYGAKCPLSWPDGAFRNCYATNSPYWHWREADGVQDTETRKVLARIIAYLPWSLERERANARERGQGL